MPEVWKPIPDFPGYEVSDLGNVRSLDRVVERPTKGSYLRRGVPLQPIIVAARNRTGTRYRQVTVYGPGGKKKPLKVGALVLSAHVGPRPAGQVMRHLDDNSLDDRLVNLTWGTYTENAQDAWANGNLAHRGEQHCGAKLTDSAVLAIRAALATGVAMTELAKQYGVDPKTIHAIKTRRTWKHLPEGES